ncbi:hypothetical protein NOS3756_40970 [Nostoc sp. NIES-3756]|jgi:hypothetical protein|uniref:hypothetical protein n=1 Tax=Nostoc sp. NIES-3756 TaxID=1751286 RepID=UPI0007214EF3|nr:hypothetical protein [Nostoc sp. NIES-3756]BAT55119.1 hypothetical protein NOS3756_40970 [Nostoc sp. NIES-3756]BAY37099.1 hypothetical protein NIES2111_14340 [Nostoc sp. NIES-2111]
MASIAISDIRPVGHELLFDSESYMTELNSNELDRIVGGTDPISLGVAAFVIVVGAGLTGFAIGSALK